MVCVSTTAALSCAHGLLLLLTAFATGGGRTSFVSTGQPQKPSSLLHTEPVTRAARRGLENDRNITVTRCRELLCLWSKLARHSRASGSCVRVLPCPKAGQAFSGVGTRAPGQGAASEQRGEKDHGLVNGKSEGKPHQPPPSSQGR